MEYGYGRGNEIAQDRNKKELKNISNENMGGKNLPDAYISGGTITLNQEDIELMKKYNIPIIEIDRKKYIELPQKSQQKTDETEKIEER